VIQVTLKRYRHVVRHVRAASLTLCKHKTHPLSLKCLQIFIFKNKLKIFSQNGTEPLTFQKQTKKLNFCGLTVGEQYQG
jgi:hypothetical protein